MIIHNSPTLAVGYIFSEEVISIFHQAELGPLLFKEGYEEVK